jgi:5-formyltetrahydrofolate cyclo-ligase
VSAEKELLRKRAFACPVSPALSARLSWHLRIWHRWKSATTVCAFSALGDEPDVLCPWPDDKRIALPRVEGHEMSMWWADGPASLVRGKFGIPEPAPGARPAGTAFDLILVPGVAFDRGGGRLGRGRGFYDRFLAQASGFFVGICLDDRLISDVPVEAHDMRMDAVVTPSGIISCSGSQASGSGSGTSRSQSASTAV